jgi:hypothetical protein
MEDFVKGLEKSMKLGLINKEEAKTWLKLYVEAKLNGMILNRGDN